MLILMLILMFNVVSDLVNENCNFKSWETLKKEYHLDNKLYFQWMQLV